MIEGGARALALVSPFDVYAHYPMASYQRSPWPEEDDIASARITELLQEETFSFISSEYQRIPRSLFQGIFKFSGKHRTYKKTKEECVLNGASVL